MAASGKFARHGGHTNMDARKQAIVEKLRRTDGTGIAGSKMPEGFEDHELVAVYLRAAGVYAIRPKGALGTCGWVDGRPWQVRYVNHKNLPRSVAIIE